MITLKAKGDLSKFTKRVNRQVNAAKMTLLDKYGREGVLALVRYSC